MFRVAIVGGGQAGRLHLKAISSIPDLKIQALVEPRPGVREELSRVFSIATLHEQLESALESVDIVCLATPPALHYEQASQVLAAGRALVLEKPVCLHLQDADRLVELGRGHKVLVGHNLRHHRLVAQARGLCRTLGAVQAVRSVSCRVRPAELKTDFLTELGTHHFDLMRDLLGLEIEQATARESRGGVAYLAQAGDALISSQFYDSPQALNRMDIDFEGGRLSLDFFRFDGLTCVRPGRSARWDEISGPFQQLPSFWRESKPFGGDFLASYRNQWLHFLDCLTRDVPCRASLQDGREALRWALQPLVV